MNQATFDRILRQVLLVPVLAIMAVSAIIYVQIHAANSTVAQIQMADENVTQTLKIEQLIIDQETALRGFQTTQDASFLDPFRAADEQLPAEFNRSRALALDPSRIAPVNELEQAHNTWEAGFAIPLIATMQAGGNTSDRDLNRLGKRQMDGMRRRLTELTTDSTQRRNRYIQRWHEQVRTTSLILVLIAILVGFGIGLYTRRLMQDVSSAYHQSSNVLRIRAEQTFRSEQKLRTTLQSIGDGVITCDADGAVSTMNDVAQELTGWTEEEARSLPLEEVFHIVDEATRSVVENPVDKVKRSNRVIGLANHTVLIRRDGRELFIDDSGSPIRDQQGKLIGVVLVFRDITLARKSQDALLANEKLAVAGRLAATIAHEIHNPLDSVANLLYLMEFEATPEESKQFLQMAKEEIARVTHISRAMLSLYRESRAPVPIDLKEMLESILLLMERRFQTLSVTVQPDLGETLIIRGFPAELRQVFTNLLTNAAEAAGPGGHILISAQPCPAGLDAQGRRHEGGALVTIADNGPGIPEKMQEQLFQPFFTTKGERGTGLGLWVSRGIITKHGGQIELTSSTDETTHGTRVQVFLATDPVVNPGG